MEIPIASSGRKLALDHVARASRCAKPTAGHFSSRRQRTPISPADAGAERLESEVAERTAELRTARDRAESPPPPKTKFLATASTISASRCRRWRCCSEVSDARSADRRRAKDHAGDRASLGAGMELLDALLEFIRLDAGAMRRS